LAEWAKQAARYPGLLAALGDYYSVRKQYADAERCLVASKQLTPNPSVYDRLSKIYRVQGMSDKWLATLRESLEQPCSGLEHAYANMAIAHYYMNRRQWQEALPYAEGAGASYAGFGLHVAGACHEAIQNWEQAEQYFAACSQRYREAGTDWHLFCRRTGKGNLDAARQWAAQSLETITDMQKYLPANGIMLYRLLENQSEAATAELDKSVRAGSERAILLKALFLDRLKDSRARLRPSSPRGGFGQSEASSR
jgi:tetratricopeptide (TPR) repeat protein